MSRLVLIVRSELELADTAPVANGVEYVAFPRPTDSYHLLTNFEYWLKEAQFGYRLRVQRYATSSVTWQCVYVLPFPLVIMRRL